MPSLFKAPSWKTLRALFRGFGLLLAWRFSFAFAAWRLSGLHPTMASFEAHRAALTVWAASNPPWAWSVYLLIYTSICALCLDGTATLVAFSGALFGFGWGLLLSTVGSSLGALAVFLFSRRYLAAWLHESFPQAVGFVVRGLERDGDAWLLTARMVPMVSYPMTNLTLGLSPMKSGRFLLLSTLGLLPCNATYVWAGTHLAGIHHFHDLLAPSVWAALAALGLLPLLARYTVHHLRGRLKRTP